ncbi:hypothetical protein [Paludisphaera borealis]|uniref:RiboL-PSP-HEPN domain-containing protein n=1 Tax=Paludisphaera borealis TaxID=1387353 RepID=A0A1U7CX61_9BACT|nr:hypothetical protein [Paludisphaera borealis]APW63525.1 hypothetical protein BSF38_05097 [Paludisphaera borealis]
MTSRQRYRARIDEDLASVYKNLSVAYIKALNYQVSLWEYAERERERPRTQEEIEFIEEKTNGEQPVYEHWSEQFGLDLMTPYVEQEVENKSYFMYNLLLVWIWSITEAKLNDVAENFVLADPSVLTGPKFKNIKLGVDHFVGGRRKSDAYRMIFAEYKREAAPESKVGIGRFESMFDALGLKGGVPKEVRALFLEMSEVRHNMVHRMGVIDQKMAERIPRLTTKIGGTIAVQREFILSSMHAVKFYILEIDIRIRNHFGEPIPESAAKLHGSYAPRPHIKHDETDKAGPLGPSQIRTN